MKIALYLSCLVCLSFISYAQNRQFEDGKGYNEALDSTAVPRQIVVALHRLVPDAIEVSWGHMFCTKCPKDGTYSYYQAEFYQDAEQGNMTFNESAQPVAFKLKTELARTPNPVQNAILKVKRNLERDFQRVNVEITSFNIKEKILYGVVFYIPTEDKKHWTQYEELVFTERGNTTKIKID